MRFKVLFEKHFEEKGFFNSLWPTVVIPPVSVIRLANVLTYTKQRPRLRMLLLAFVKDCLLVIFAARSSSNSRVSVTRMGIAHF